MELNELEIKLCRVNQLKEDLKLAVAELESQQAIMKAAQQARDYLFLELLGAQKEANELAREMIYGTNRV